MEGTQDSSRSIVKCPTHCNNMQLVYGNINADGLTRTGLYSQKRGPLL